MPDIQNPTVENVYYSLSDPRALHSKLVEMILGINTNTTGLASLAAIVAGLSSPITEGTPVNAVAATGTLTFTGVVSDGEEVAIGGRTYEFDADGNVSAVDHVAVDISAGTKTQARGTLTFNGTVADGETVTLAGTVFEFDTNSAVVGTNVAVDISLGGTKATAKISFTGPVANGQTVTIGNTVYEFDTDAGSSVGDGNVRVDVVADQTAVAAAAALITAITGDANAVVTAAADGVQAVDVTALYPGVYGNDIAVSTTCLNASWNTAELTAGANCSGADAATALILAIDAEFATLEAVTGGAGICHVDAVAAGAFDGSAGNAVDVAEACANAVWTEFAGGSDCTAAEAIVALAAAITADDVSQVSAVDGNGDTLVATAKVRGTAGNALTTTDSCANAGWGAGALAGGVNGTVGTNNQTMVDNSYVYYCIGTNTIADANWRRISLGTAY